jgi:hypothetical protein
MGRRRDSKREGKEKKAVVGRPTRNEEIGL